MWLSDISPYAPDTKGPTSDGVFTNSVVAAGALGRIAAFGSNTPNEQRGWFKSSLSDNTFTFTPHKIENLHERNSIIPFY